MGKAALSFGLVAVALAALADVVVRVEVIDDDQKGQVYSGNEAYVSTTYSDHGDDSRAIIYNTSQITVKERTYLPEVPLAERPREGMMYALFSGYATGDNINRAACYWEVDDSSQLAFATNATKYADEDERAQALSVGQMDVQVFGEFNVVKSGYVPNSQSTTNRLHLVRNRYRLSYDANGGTLVPAATNGCISGVTMNLSTNKPVRTGFTFDGWTRNAGSSVSQYNAGGPVAFSTDTTLYAVWSTNEYTATFSLDNGEDDIPKSVAYGAALKAPANPSRTGHSFAGWMPSVPATMPASNLTFTAQWTANIYQASFDANGGAPSSKTNLAYGAALKAPANPSRTGHSFAGWTPSVPATMPASNATFRAVWKVNTYFLVFDSNGGSGSMARQDAAFGEVVVLDGNTFTRTGYTFAGWAKTADGAVAYRDGQSVSNLSSVQGATIKLYAVWTPVEYSVSFVANGGTGTMRAQTLTYDRSALLASNAFTRAGFAFAGWAKTTDGSVSYDDAQSVVNLSSEAGAVVTLYAVWEVNSYSIAFDANGGSGEAMETIVVSYTEEVRLSENTFVRTGYTYEGWATKATARTIDYADRATVSRLTSVNRATVTLYAVWTANTYSISFDAAGGSPCAAMSLAYDSTYGTLPEPERTGYSFDGWFDDAHARVEATTRMTTAADSTLHARWTPVSYSVAFDANGGSGKMDRQIFTYDQPTNLAPVAFTRVGHAFAGWNRAADGLAAAFEDGQAVTNLSATTGEVVPLYAQWEAYSYKLSFDANGGSGDEVVVIGDQGATNEVEYGEVFLLPECTYTRAGRAFAGWRIGSTTFAAGTAVSNLAATAGALVAIKAGWVLQPGEFSQALDVENLSFASENGWTVVTNDTAAGGTCLRAPFTGESLEVAALTDVDGTVSFKWKIYYSSGREELRSNAEFGAYAGATNVWLVQQPPQMDEWETVTLAVPENAGSFMLRFKASLSSPSADPCYVFVDSVVWQPSIALGDDQYGIVFSGGEGAEGEMEPMVCDPGRVYPLTANAFTKPGHVFAGWRRLDDGRRYDDGVFVFDLAADGCLVMLEAVWVPSGE